MEYLYGLQPVLAALRSSHRRILQLLLYESGTKINSPAMQQVMSLAEERKIRLQFTTKTQLDDLCEHRPHQNVALQVHPLRIAEVDEPSPSLSPLSLMLADVTDPQNVGSILRTALFFGINRVYLSKGCSGLSPALSKASAGALEAFGSGGLAYCKKAPSFINAANSLGWKTIASAAPGLPGIEEYLLSTKVGIERESPKDGETGKYLLILGNEGSGIPRGMLARCKYSMNISGCDASVQSGLDSLNVGTAAAVLIDRLSHKLDH